jgi:membrane-associated phospholipid phosphatase
MNKVGLLIKGNAFFFLGITIILIIGMGLLMIKGKASSFILLNSYHSNWLNNFFISYTFIGNGVFAICLAAIYFFLAKKNTAALLIVLSFLLSGIIVQVVKHLFFSPRPKLFFGEGCHRFFIQGIEFYHNNSFPSGHTTTVFAVATVLVLLSKNRIVQWPVLIGAVLVGYSRIYLGQHFLLDVLIGAIIGILTGIGCVYVAYRYSFTRQPFKLFNFKLQSPVTLPGSI